MLVIPAIGQQPIATGVDSSPVEPRRRSGNGSIRPASLEMDRGMNSTIMPRAASGNAPPAEGHLMCGRYTLRASPAELAEIFSLLRQPDLTPRFNIAPGQSVAAIVFDPERTPHELVS